LFAEAHLLAGWLHEIGSAEAVVRSIVVAMAIKTDGIEIDLNPGVIGVESRTGWAWSIPLPTRKPFREAKLRIDAQGDGPLPTNDLLDFVAGALAVQQLVLGSPELSLNQLAKREGRCRTQLARLLRISWLSPRIVDAIVDGCQPKALTRRALLMCDLPVDWTDQERMFGFAA